MEKATYKLNICGTDYVITAEEDSSYMLELSREVDEKLKDALRNGKLSMTQGAVFVALEYADLAKKATATADNLRGQLKEYLEDAAKAKSECDFYKRELEKLKGGDASAVKGQTSLWG